jgi:hypothetical protein
MSNHLPEGAADRKALPLYSGLIRYFPDALIAVAELSRIGNDQHNPGKPLHWDRSKSKDEHDALVRHLFEAGTVDTDGVLHSTKVAWRALAALQKEIEGIRISEREAIQLRELIDHLSKEMSKARRGIAGDLELHPHTWEPGNPAEE